MNFLTVLTDRKLDAGETRRYEPIVLNLSDMRLKPGKYDILTEFQVYEILDEEGDQISKSRYRLTAYKLLDLDESDISGS